MHGLWRVGCFPEKLVLVLDLFQLLKFLFLTVGYKPAMRARLCVVHLIMLQLRLCIQRSVCSWNHRIRGMRRRVDIMDLQKLQRSCIHTSVEIILLRWERNMSFFPDIGTHLEHLSHFCGYLITSLPSSCGANYLGF